MNKLFKIPRTGILKLGAVQGNSFLSKLKAIVCPPKPTMESLIVRFGGIRLSELLKRLLG